jgi:hypothetical protein
MPTEPEPITLFQVVQRAVEVCDPDGADEDVAELLLRFEDSDEPVTAVADVEQRLAEAAGTMDPEGDNPVLQMTVATATYLAFRRDQLDDDPDELLLLAARAEFGNNPPEPVADWLEQAGIDV